jgi:hypothetical protein
MRWQAEVGDMISRGRSGGRPKLSVMKDLTRDIRTGRSCIQVAYKGYIMQVAYNGYIMRYILM